MLKKSTIKEQSLVYFINSIKKEICSDDFFHYLIENSQSVRQLLCQSLIDDVLIKETVLEDVQSYHSLKGGKKLILDIVASDEEGRYYNIEMQVGSIDENDFIRFQCYSAKLLEKQEKKGEEYRQIKDIYQFIISDKLIGDLNRYQHDFHMYDHKHCVSLPYHKIHTRIIQLPKIEEMLMSNDRVQPIDEVMYMFATGKKYKKEACEEVNIMWEAYSRYVQSDRFLSDYAEFRDEMLYRSKMSSAKENGEKEILKIMLKTKYQEECDWLDRCTTKQRQHIAEIIFKDMTLEELKKQALES
ncbi:MAG: PD-(D/E)XK nuclease family transposase [Coprobacillus sp.]